MAEKKLVDKGGKEANESLHPIPRDIVELDPVTGNPKGGNEMEDFAILPDAPSAEPESQPKEEPAAKEAEKPDPSKAVEPKVEDLKEPKKEEEKTDKEPPKEDEATDKRLKDKDKHIKNVETENAYLKDTIAQANEVVTKAKEFQEFYGKYKDIVPELEGRKALDETLSNIQVPVEEMTGEKDGNAFATDADKLKMLQRDKNAFDQLLTRKMEIQVQAHQKKIQEQQARQNQVLIKLQQQYPEITDQKVMNELKTKLTQGQLRTINDPNSDPEVQYGLIKGAYLEVLQGRPAAAKVAEKTQEELKLDLEATELAKAKAQRLEGVAAKPAGGSEIVDRLKKEAAAMEALESQGKLPYDMK